MIERRVSELIADFEKETGKQPRYLYLGSAEMNQLAEFGLKAHITNIETSYNGMVVLEVVQIHHMRCS